MEIGFSASLRSSQAEVNWPKTSGRLTKSGSWMLLHHGPGLSGLCAVVSDRSHQTLPRHQRERRKEPDMVRRRRRCVHRDRQEGIEARCLALYLSTDSAGLDL